MKLLLATRNAHKAQEVAAILRGTGFEITTLLDHPELPEPPETGVTFEQNALQKAAFVQERVGGVVLADDSGLEVDALAGRPGVWSKRYSEEGTDEANNRKLLAEMEEIPVRRARFRCVLALVTPTYRGTIDGTCEGTITLAPRGTNGFGYDPVFSPEALPEFTMAELTTAQKNLISHRGMAFRRLPELLRRAGLLR